MDIKSFTCMWYTTYIKMEKRYDFGEYSLPNLLPSGGALSS